MLQHFLNGPVPPARNTNEAYELAWRPLGAKPLTLAAQQAPKREKKKSRRPAR